MKNILFLLFALLTVFVGCKRANKLRSTNDYTNSVILRNRLNNATHGVYNVLDYGAKGDSTTLDQTACQNAINACQAAGGGTVFFPKGKYRVNYLQVTGDVNLIGSDAKLVGTSSSVNHYLIEVTGHLVRNTVLTDDGAIGDNHVHAISTGFVAGDYIVISDSTYAYTTYGRNQEFNRVLSVSTGIVNLTRTLIGNYTATSTGRIYKYSPIKDIVIQGFKLEVLKPIYAGGIKLNYCYNVKINDCTVRNPYIHAISVNRSTEISLISAKAIDGQENTASNSYGFEIAESSHHCLITNCYTENVRESHVSDFVRFVKISGNIFKNSYIDGINTHGSGSSFIDISNNLIEGGGSGSAGIDIGGTLAADHDIIVSGNTITNTQNHGIGISSVGGKELSKIIVKDNSITNFGIESASNDYGIIMGYCKDSEISGNTIEGVNNGADYALYIYNDTIINISNNKLFDMPNGYGFGYELSDKIFFSSNFISGIASYNLRVRDICTHVVLANSVSDDNTNSLAGTETSINNTWGW